MNISDVSPALFTVGALNGSQLVAAVALDGTYVADPTVVPGSRGASAQEAHLFLIHHFCELIDATFK